MDFAALPVGNGLYRVHRFLGAAQHSLGFNDKHAARFRKADSFGSAVEKCDAKFILQIADLAAQRRLRDMKPGRSARDVLLFSDGDKISKMAQFHPQPSIPFEHIAPSNLM